MERAVAQMVSVVTLQPRVEMDARLIATRKLSVGNMAPLASNIVL